MSHTFQLPSGLEVELREMTGAEEEILTSARLIRSGEALNQVMKNCLVQLGDKTELDAKDVLCLLSGDRLFILVKLREISLGETVDLMLTCPNQNCRGKTAATVNLSELEVTPYTEAREFSATLPSGRTVRFTHLDGFKEKRLATIPDANITTAMLIRLVSLDGEAPSKKLMAEMSLKDRSALRQEMQKADAGPDTTVETECEHCGTSIKTRLEAEAAFLFPGLR